MDIAAFVINLDRSTDRWQRLSAQAKVAGVAVTRIPGVDGRAVAREDWVDVDEGAFLRRNGRTILPGEYGCYRSHLKALESFLNTSHAIAVIMEDDVDMPADLMARTDAIFCAVPQGDIVKLVNHRSRGFRRRGRSEMGDEIGRCIHGPQGSAACYAVTRAGAARLLQGIAVMREPYDIALERGWQHGASTMTVRHDLAGLTREISPTEIGTREDYRRTKIRGIRKTATHVHRMLEYLRRIRYAL